MQPPFLVDEPFEKVVTGAADGLFTDWRVARPPLVTPNGTIVFPAKDLRDGFFSLGLYRQRLNEPGVQRLFQSGEAAPTPFPGGYVLRALEEIQFDLAEPDILVMIAAYELPPLPEETESRDFGMTLLMDGGLGLGARLRSRDAVFEREGAEPIYFQQPLVQVDPESDQPIIAFVAVYHTFTINPPKPTHDRIYVQKGDAPPRLVVETGDSLPGASSARQFQSDLLVAYAEDRHRMALSRAGDVAFTSYLRFDHEFWIWRYATGALEKGVARGDPLPGAPGVTVDQVYSFVMNDDGRIAVSTFNSNFRSTLWSIEPDGTKTILVRDGDDIAVAGGGEAQGVVLGGVLAINSRGDIAFTVSPSGGSFPGPLLLVLEDGVYRAAVSGSPAADFPSLKVEGIQELQLNADGGVLLLDLVRHRLWAAERGGPARCLAQVFPNEFRIGTEPDGQPAVRQAEGFRGSLGGGNEVALGVSYRDDDGDTGLFRIALAPRVVEEEVLELEIVPAGYDDWIPEAGLSEAQEGSSISIRARLVKKGGGAPKDARVQTYTFELSEVSTEPGMAMNFPLVPLEPPPEDLLFRAERNPSPLWSLPADGLRMESGPAAEGSLESPPAIVSSFDPGGWGVLTVKARLADGKEIEGHLTGDPLAQRVLLPRRAEGSHIADAWKRRWEATTLSDDDDSDSEPGGDGHPGDGFTLYEEYRGFVLGQANRQVRTDPHTKDFFIHDRAGVPALIALLNTETGLDGHRLVKGQIRLPDRVMNFNRRQGAHLEDQHGIVMEHGKLPKDVAGRANGGPGLPRSITSIVLASGLASTTVETSVIYQGEAITVSNPVRTAVHELLHSSNVYHHGQTDSKAFWSVGEGDGSLIHEEDGIPVLLVGGDGGFLIPTRKPKDPVRFSVGVEGGQHSGDADCMMAYKAADVFPARGDDRFCALPDGSPCVKYYQAPDFDVFPRRSFCSAAAGTQYSAGDWRPYSSFGDASAGCCQHQLCVNDRMPHIPKAGPTPCPAGGGGGGGDRELLLAESRGAGAGAPPVDPTLAVTVNDAADLVLYRGWPAIVLVKVLPPRFLDTSPDVEPFSISAPAGAWADALELAVQDSAGAAVDWPAEKVPAEGQTLHLDPESAGLVVFLIAPEATAALAAGSYRVGAVLDTTAFPGGWQGRVSAEEVVTVEVQDAPAPIPDEEAIELSLLEAIRQFLRGDPVQAHLDLDEVLALVPRSPGALGLRAFFLDGEGKVDEALTAYEEAIEAHEEADPEAPEPPFELLERHGELWAQTLQSQPPPEGLFLRGDANGDRTANLSDAVAILSYLFLGGEIAGGCEKSADVNDNARVDITDPIFLLGFLFLGGQGIPAPYPACGADPTEDELPCGRTGC